MGDRSFDQIKEEISRYVRKLAQTSLSTIEKRKKEGEPKFSPTYLPWWKSHYFKGMDSRYAIVGTRFLLCSDTGRFL